MKPPSTTGNRSRPRAAWGWLPLLVGVWLGIVSLTAPVVVRASDNPSVTATLSETLTTVGAPVELNITVVGSSSIGRVEPSEVDGLTIQQRGNTQSYQVRNFTVTEQNSYLFLVTPQRAGTFTLPEVEVQVGSRRLRTPRLTLTATAGNPTRPGGNGPAGAQVRAELLLPKRTAYVGEAVPAEFRVTFSPRVELLESGDAPQLAGEGFAVGRWTQPQGSGLRLGGNGSFGNGGGGQRLVYKAVITAARVGTLTLGPGETIAVVRLPGARTRSRDPFDDDPLSGLLGQVFAPPRQVKLSAEAVPLEVRPLPTAGQPADFTGGVGRFELGPVEILSPARGTAVRAGDPVVVRVSVRGQGNFDRLGPPLPESKEGLRTYEPKDRFKAEDDVGLSGVKTFEQTLIPTGPRDSLPGFHFSYFDPVTETYQTLRAPAVPLKVLPGVVPAAAPVVVASPAPAVPAAPAAEETLRPLRLTPGPAVPGWAWRPVFARRGFWSAQLIPLAALVGLLTILRALVRRRDAEFQRRAVQARERENLWRTVRDPRAGRRAFLTAAVRLLEGAPAEDVDVANLRVRHAEMVYGGGAEGGDDPGTVSPEERAEVLMVLRGNPSTRGAASSSTAVTTAAVLLAVVSGLATPSPARADAAADDFALGNAAYEKGQFTEAADAYERVLARSGTTPVGANVFYNLGNACARLGQRGRAAVNFRRALLRDPGNLDAAANLALVRRQLQVPADAVLPPALPPWLMDRLPGPALVYGANSGVLAAAVGGWLFVGGLAVAAGRGLGATARRRGRRLALGLGLPLTLLGLAMAGTLGRPAQEAARTVVVTSRRVDAHEQPADNSRVVGTLTECGEARLLAAQGPWTRVGLADGRAGFVLSERVIPVETASR